MFAGIVPPDHLYRLWDVLLYDGKLSLETHKVNLRSPRPYLSLPHRSHSPYSLEASIDEHATP